MVQARSTAEWEAAQFNRQKLSQRWGLLHSHIPEVSGTSILLNPVTHLSVLLFLFSHPHSGKDKNDKDKWSLSFPESFVPGALAFFPSPLTSLLPVTSWIPGI